jgi:valyl-tRNA synthetase
MQTMETRFAPETVEPKWLETWQGAGAYRPSGVGEAYSIVIPPPNVTGALHLGHALNNTIQDTLIRWQRKLGKNTLWMPGTDHAGIATQAVVEKRLLELEGKTRHDIGRDALVGRIWDWKAEYEARITNQLKSIGSSCDWERQRFTLDPMCARAVRHTFFNFFRKDLIYRGKRLVNWDTHLQTAVADDEIYHETKKGHMWYFRYPLADGSGFLPVATTRPETILGDTAVAVHPDDERYKHLIGKMLRVPFVNREIPIIADGLLVDPEFGTGCVKVTPAHDPNDYQTGLRHKLPMINIMTADGLVNENGGPFAGLSFPKARKAIVAGLEEQELLIEAKDHELQLGHSDRSKTPIEPFLSDQWFVAMGDLAEKAMAAVEDGRVKFTPERYAKTYLDWLGEKRDWCISRQLWWGHRIPIWYAEGVTEADLEKAFGGRADISWKLAEDGKTWLICAQEEDLAVDALPGCTLRRDDDVLDTWFSSALWPHSTLGWPEANADLKTWYPGAVLVTSRDIISLWVARMVITGLENLGEIPFHQVYIHPKILDGEGKTMSKSRGNGVDPLDIVAKYGSDALRFTMCGLCTDNQDARLPVKPEVQPDGRTINTSEKFEQGRNFANKIWNACRFVAGNMVEGQDYIWTGDLNSASLEDRWILSRLHSTLAQVNASLETYKFSDLVQVLYRFTWDDLCSRYLEIKKASLGEGAEPEARRQTVALFLHVLDQLLGMLHPVMPFLTEELHTLLFSGQGMLIAKAWPVQHPELVDLNIEAQFERVFEIVEAARSVRGDYALSPARELDVVVSLQDSQEVASLLGNTHLIKALAKVATFEVRSGGDAPKFSARKVLRGGEVFVPLAGILDPDKERARIVAEMEKTRKFIGAIEGKLKNEKFVSGAPDAVVQLEKDKLANQKDVLSKLEQGLADLADVAS